MSAHQQEFQRNVLAPPAGLPALPRALPPHQEWHRRQATSGRMGLRVRMQVTWTAPGHSAGVRDMPTLRGAPRRPLAHTANLGGHGFLPPSQAGNGGAEGFGDEGRVTRPHSGGAGLGSSAVACKGPAVPEHGQACPRPLREARAPAGPSAPSLGRALPGADPRVLWHLRAGAHLRLPTARASGRCARESGQGWVLGLEERGVGDGGL